MNLLKKIFLVSMAVVLTFTFVACDSESEETTSLLYDIETSDIDTKAKTYKNNYLGIEAAFPDDWVLYSSSIVAENNGVTGEMTSEIISALLGDEDISEVIDCMARSNDSYMSVMVTYQPYDFISDPMTEESFAEQMVETMAVTLEEDYDFDDAASAVVEAEFAGDTHYTVKISGSYNGNKVYEQQIYFIATDVITTVTLKTWETDDLSEIMTYFTKSE